MSAAETNKYSQLRKEKLGRAEEIPHTNVWKEVDELIKESRANSNRDLNCNDSPDGVASPLVLI